MYLNGTINMELCYGGKILQNLKFLTAEKRIQYLPAENHFQKKLQFDILILVYFYKIVSDR